MADEHKRCPFCGGIPHLMVLHAPAFKSQDKVIREAKTWHFIECVDCMAQTNEHVSEDVAWARWDRRVAA